MAEWAPNRLELKRNICFGKDWGNQKIDRITAWDCEFDWLSFISACVGVFCVCVSRSAKEAEDKIKKALDKGEVLPTEARFDSNCITPGRNTLKLSTKWTSLVKSDKSSCSKYSKYLFQGWKITFSKCMKACWVCKKKIKKNGILRISFENCKNVSSSSFHYLTVQKAITRLPQMCHLFACACLV